MLEGEALGLGVGRFEGSGLGEVLGLELGVKVGEDEGDDVGMLDGVEVGSNVGYADGYTVGLVDGRGDGLEVGVLDGIIDGFDDGCTLCRYSRSLPAHTPHADRVRRRRTARTPHAHARERAWRQLRHVGRDGDTEAGAGAALGHGQHAAAGQRKGQLRGQHSKGADGRRDARVHGVTGEGRKRERDRGASERGRHCDARAARQPPRVRVEAERRLRAQH